MRNFSHIGQSCEYFEEPDHNPDEVTMDDITAHYVFHFFFTLDINRNYSVTINLHMELPLSYY